MTKVREALRRLLAEVGQIAPALDVFPDELGGAINQASAALAADDWEPIETAPRDKKILGYVRGYGAGSMFWQEVTTGYYADELTTLRGWRIHGMLIEVGHDPQPTHWQPLPPPPKG